jgi:telomerase reverse transcriptase
MPPQVCGPTLNCKEASKRKRKRAPAQHVPTELSGSGRPAKRLKGTAANLQPAAVVKHALLAQYYPIVLTLRQYVLESMPASSKIRRRKISAVGKDGQAAAEHTGTPDSKKDLGNIRTSLATLLDTTLVGTNKYPTAFREAQPDDRLEQWVEYSQKRDSSSVSLPGGADGAIDCQVEVGPPNH